MRACVVQGSQQIWITALWYWGDSLNNTKIKTPPWWIVLVRELWHTVNIGNERTRVSHGVLCPHAVISNLTKLMKHLEAPVVF